jgi:hypothetical protein
MHEPEIPEDVQALLRERIGSYEELEILLLLAREPAAAFTADSVGQRVRVPGPAAAGALDRLCAAGLATGCAGSGSGSEQTGSAFRYQPRGDLDRAVELLVREARDNPLAIIKLMSANAIERIRMSAVQMFADAFVLGKDRDKKDG